LMKIVAQNAKRGAQFTPQGVLRFPLKGTDPPDILLEIRILLEELTSTQAVEVAASTKRQ
jgi:transcription-repair coupling factor (superfamily II helicase)